MNKTLYQDEQNNAIRFSSLKKAEQAIQFKGLAVKYVAAGKEMYCVNNKKFVVHEGEYLIGNDFTQSMVKIDHHEDVKGLCIDISPKIIEEVADFHAVSGADLTDFLLSDQFFVNRYNAKHTSLGYGLREINRKIGVGAISNELQNSELFYSLAEAIVTDQRLVFEQLHKLPFKKWDTNEQVLRGLMEAKLFMDERFLENVSLDHLCLQIGISKYHFIRLFKHLYGVSPYHYQKFKRLEHAQSLIQSGWSVAQVALEVGYADVPTFSKAFKLLFGFTPGHSRKSNF